MKERIDKILMFAIYFYAVLCITSIFSCGLGFNSGIYDFVNTLTFTEVYYTQFTNFLTGSLDSMNHCKAVYFDYLQFLILGILITIRYLISGKTYQK